MASIGITESTFAVTLLAEQQVKTWDDVTSYPILPTLFDEAGVGWDAFVPEVGVPMFLQFKLSDYMVHGNSAHHDFLTGVPYYRFNLNEKDDFEQHRRLRALSATYPDTYYVAPEIHTPDSFLGAYLDQTIIEHSRYVPVANCFDITGGTHHEMFYCAGDDFAWQASEPKKLLTTPGHRLRDQLVGRSKEWQRIDRRFGLKLVAELARASSMRVPRLEQNAQEADVFRLLRIAADLALSLGSHLSIIGMPPSVIQG